jgi:hypothetical protein
MNVLLRLIAAMAPLARCELIEKLSDQIQFRQRFQRFWC